MKANKDKKFELDEELVHKFELANKSNNNKKTVMECIKQINKLET